MTRRKSNLSSVVSDTVSIASRLPWWGALLFGLAAFTLLHELIPFWLESRLHSAEGNHLYPIIEVLYNKHLNKFHWVGTACFFVGVIFAIRNFIVQSEADYFERGIIGYIAKLLGRNID